MTSHHEPLILHSGQSTQSYCKCSVNLCLATPHTTYLTWHMTHLRLRR